MKKNKTLFTILGILAGLLFIAFMIVVWGIRVNNRLVPLEEGVTAQWAQVESSYQRRADLIPNLVSTVKGYADFEQETLTAVIEARAKATSVSIDPSNLTPEAIAQFDGAQQGLSSSLSRLLVTIERYPDLKANQNFLTLQDQLEGTENRIAFERKKYNDTVRAFNSTIRKIPTNIIANRIGMEAKGYFESTRGADIAPVEEF